MPKNSFLIHIHLIFEVMHFQYQVKCITVTENTQMFLGIEHSTNTLLFLLKTQNDHSSSGNLSYEILHSLTMTYFCKVYLRMDFVFKKYRSRSRSLQETTRFVTMTKRETGLHVTSVKWQQSPLYLNLQIYSLYINSKASSVLSIEHYILWMCKRWRWIRSELIVTKFKSDIFYNFWS